MSTIMNAVRAVTRQGPDYFKRSSYHVDHRFASANDLLSVEQDYDLLVLDRDCAIERHHGGRIEPQFQSTLERIAGKSVILSNSSFGEFCRIGDIYTDMHVSKLVDLRGRDGETYTSLLDIFKRELSVIDADTFAIYEQYALDKFDKDAFAARITAEYTKPDPRPLNATIQLQKFLRHKALGKVLMFGDRYFTDIMCGNLAGTDTAIVKPYKPFSEIKRPHLLLFMRPLEMTYGELMSRSARR